MEKVLLRSSWKSVKASKGSNDLHAEVALVDFRELFLSNGSGELLETIHLLVAAGAGTNATDNEITLSEKIVVSGVSFCPEVSGMIVWVGTSS